MKEIKTGSRFGDWEVVKEGPQTTDFHRQWLCRCKCGYERLFTTSYLNKCHGKKKCKECRSKEENNILCEKHVGKTFGCFTIVKLLDRSAGHGGRQWLCRCKCGYERVFFTSYLFGNGKRKATKCEKCCVLEMEMENRITDCVPQRFWQRFLDHSKRRGIEVLVSKEEAYDLYVRQQRTCALSGLNLYFTTLRTNFNRYTNASLDRIDSNKPYAIDNVQWVHKTINMMKQQYSQQTFIEMCKLVAEKC